MLIMGDVVMKHICIVVIVFWSSVIIGKADGHVIPKDSQLLLKTNGNNVYRGDDNGGSWLQMVLVFARDAPDSQSKQLIEETPCNKSDDTVICPQNTTVCKDGFILLGSNRCYHFSCVNETWERALEYCKRMGTTLAHPLDVVEDTILRNYIALNFKGTAGWYLGGTDVATEGKWLWAHDYSPIGYTNWGSNQPDNAHNNEDCLHYWEDVDWKWNDTPCDNLLWFVCQQ